MAMMAGRVLLVCALCVLWCGAGGGGLAEKTQDRLDTASEESKSPKKNKDTDGSAGTDGPTAKTKAPQAADRGSKEQEGTVEQAAASVPGVTGAGAGMETAPQPGREATESAKGTRGNKEETKKEEESEKELEEGEEEEEEEKEREKEKKEEDDTDAKKGISADSQEQRSLPSGAEGASNQTKPKSAQTTDVNDPAAEGAGKRKEKQNENKEANPKKTPVEATAMKTTTATPGDSDSSTAASHTTSPLLLLLFVACAAVAAVVAA
ncbi:Mucin-associated surface protein (MASP), subgroup S070 [Trypanosoma cruzi]|nr:Mucin-associated surface protein (MASP), subgroup S070 [Trypanosoma cruzi]